MSKRAELEYIRKGRFVHLPNGDLWKEFPSIAKAKKWSWEIQKTNGGLGMGAVKVEEPKKSKVIFRDNKLVLGEV